MNARTQLRTAYRHARLFYRNVLTGMHPDTAKFEYICTMEAFNIAPSVWKHALQVLDLDALDAFLQLPKRAHEVGYRDFAIGQSFSLYPPRRPSEVIVILDIKRGRYPIPVDLHKKRKYQRIDNSITIARLLDTKTGRIYWTGFSCATVRKLATYPQRASGAGWLGWIDDRFKDELIEERDYNPRELLRI